MEPARDRGKSKGGQHHPWILIWKDVAKNLYLPWFDYRLGIHSYLSKRTSFSFSKCNEAHVILIKRRIRSVIQVVLAVWNHPQGLGGPVVLFYCLTRPGFYAAVQLLMFPPFSSFKRAKTPWTAVKRESNGSFPSTVPSSAQLHQGALSSITIEYIPAWLMEPWSRLSYNIF